MSEAPVIKRKLSGSIATMIITWINNFGTLSATVRTVKDLANGQIFIDLIQKLMAKSDCANEFDEIQNGSQTDINIRFELIKFVFRGTLAIEEGISYEAAKNSNDFELAKIAMIILIHGVNEHDEFVAAADKLDENFYSMITTFYNLCSRDKIKIPPKEVRIYDEFLNSTSNSRRSIKGSSETSHVSRNLLSGASNAANFLLSPMRRASLKSPRSKISQKSEEEFHQEKKQLEKIIHDKDLTIYDQQTLINEKEDEIKKMEIELKSYMKKNAQLTVSQTKVDECESIIERYHQTEKELKFYEHKFQDYSKIQKEVALLTETNTKHLEAIAELNAQLKHFKDVNDDHHLTLKRLSRLEKTKSDLEEKIANSQDEFQKVADKRVELSYELTVLQKKMRSLETDHQEKIDDYQYKLAMLENELNGKSAELLKLKDESGLKIAKLQTAVDKNLERLKELEESSDELQAANKEATKAQNQLSSENTLLKGEIDNLNLLVKTAEDLLDVEKAGFKKTVKETNIKLAELIKERDGLLGDLSVANKAYQDLETQCKLDIEQLISQNRENKLKLEDEFAKEKLSYDSKILALQQELKTKTIDYQNLQKYLNDVQNDREEEIKQYEQEIEAFKNDLKKATEMAKEAESCLVFEKESRAGDLARTEEIISSLRTELEGLRKNYMDLEEKKTAVGEINKKYEQDMVKLNIKIVELETQLEEETKQNMRKMDNYYSEYEAKEEQLAELVKRIEEMKESHVSEVRVLTMRSEDLKKQSEIKVTEYEAAKSEWQRELMESNDKSEKRLKELSAKVESKSKEAKSAQLELDDYKNKVRLAREKSDDLALQLQDRTDEAKRVKQELESLWSQKTADEEKNRLAVKNLTDELTKASVAYNEMKQQFLFEVQNLKQGMDEISTQLELRSKEAERYQQEVNELREKARLDCEKSKENMGLLMKTDKEKDKMLSDCEAEIRNLKLNLDDVNEKLMEVNSYLKAARVEASEAKKLVESGKSEADKLKAQLSEAVEKLNQKIEEYTSLYNELATSRNTLETIKATADEEHEALVCENASLKSEIEYLELSQAQNMKELCEEKKSNKQLVDNLKIECQTKQADLESIQKKLREVEASKQLELNSRNAELKSRLEELEAKKQADQKDAKERQTELQINLEKVKCELKLADDERCRLSDKLEDEMKKRNEELNEFKTVLQRKDQEIQEIQIKLTSVEQSQLNTSEKYQQLEMTIEQQANKLKEAEKWCTQVEVTKKQLEADICQKESQLSEFESRCQKLLAEKEKAEASLSQNYQNEYKKKENQLEEITRRCQTLEEEKNQLQTHFKKLQDEYAAGFSVKKQEYDAILAQQAAEINSLRMDNKNLAETLQMQVGEIKKHYEAEQERYNNDVKRLKNEISNKSADLEAVKKRASLFVEKQSLIEAEFEANKVKLNDLNILFEKEKKKNLDLSTKMLKELTEKSNEIELKSKELESKSAKIQDMDVQSNNIREYARKLELHYKSKKEEFAQTEKTLNDQIMQQSIDLRSLREENACFKEKCNTMKFEIQQLTKQKDCATKKLLQDESLAFSYQQNKPCNNILSTPKSNYVDDTNIKYTSPLSMGAHLMSSQNDDISRRFSIDSFSRGSSAVCGSSSMINHSINVGSYQNMPALNRFNAISENEYEEPSNNHKSLQLADNTNAVRRLSTLQTRNKQQKPHLQSSYALEDVTQTVDENSLRGEFFANKENSNRLSNINATSIKRPHDDPRIETSYIKKSR